MKKTLLKAVAIFLIGVSNFAQPQMKVLFTKSYDEVGITPRITNSGIYGLKNFGITKDLVVFATEKNLDILDLQGRKISSVKHSNLKSTGSSEAISKIENGNSFIPDYSTATESILNYDNGTYTSKQNFRAEINRVNSSLLNIIVKREGTTKNFNFNFKGDLAYGGLIGIDKSGNYFITVEKFLSQVPLKIRREIWVLSPTGEILSKLLIPTIKYLTFDNEFTINAEGELFHLITEKNGLTLVEWSGLTKRTQKIVQYPNYLQKFVHYDYFTTREEIVTKPQANNRIMTSTTRAKVLRTGEEYVEHKYYCTSQNLAPNGATARDGDAVKTPSWLRIGWNARIPYKWGGFNTVWGFDHDLAQGEFAGDIDTHGVSGYAVGVDCSGFVSRCWGLTYHASTRYMPDITHTYNSWDDLKPGDAVHKIGHVRLFVRHNSDGSLRIVEASGRNWDVSYWSYKPSDLTAYAPRYYIGMTNKYSEKSVKLLEVLKIGEKVKLHWSCDTTGVVGYRIYWSQNGKDWNLIEDEDTVKTDSFTLEKSPDLAFFRISAVSRSDGDLAESNWSNPSGVGSNGEKKYLIVDGYNRDYGSASWQGDGNPFAVIYGLALNNTNSSFESVKNSEVISGEVKLENYYGVIWYDGDESTVDETFNSTEQALIKKYLEQGGRLFVNGSEIGWDLYHRGSSADIDFYKNYFKAIYNADDANTDVAVGQEGTVFGGLTFNFGQTYTEDYPDVISPNGGSSICLKYNNGKGAGVSYTGKFGSSSKTGKLIYFAFGPESTADDSVFFRIIDGVVNYFGGNSSVANNSIQPNNFKLFNPYPNPFGKSSSSGSSTATISFSISMPTRINIAVYNSLGQRVTVLTNSKMLPGNHLIRFNANGLASGVYFLRSSFGVKTLVQKLILLK